MPAPTSYHLTEKPTLMSLNQRSDRNLIKNLSHSSSVYYKHHGGQNIKTFTSKGSETTKLDRVAEKSKFGHQIVTNTHSGNFEPLTPVMMDKLTKTSESFFPNKTIDNGVQAMRN